MALTVSQQNEMYKFFAVAFGAAPGVTYMSQLADAVKSGMTTKAIVNAFTAKSQFTDLYPNFLTDEAFANGFVRKVVGTSANEAAILEAIADVTAALNGGDSRGDVIFNVFGNLSNLVGDAKWGGTATQMDNQVAVARHYTEVKLGNTTDVAVLKNVIAAVTSISDVTTPAALDSIIASGSAATQAAVTAAAAAFTTAATAADAAVAAAVAANTTYKDAADASTAAATKAAATDATALKAASDTAAAAATAAVTADTAAKAAVVTAKAALATAIASGTALEVSTANGDLLIKESKAATAAAAVPTTAATAATALAASTAAVADDAAAATAATAAAAALTAALATGTTATTAAAAEVTAANAYAAAAALTTSAAAAAKAVADAAADVTAAAAASKAAVDAKAVVDAAAAEAAAVVVATAKLAEYTAAETAAKTALTKATADNAAYDTAAAAVSSKVLADAAILLAATSTASATAAKTAATAQATAATALKAAADATKVTTDDAAATAAVASAVAAATAADAAVSAAKTDADAAALVPANYGAKSFTLTSGIDAAANFTGGSGDDTFTANDTTGTYLLSAFDAIDGGAGAGDTFNASLKTNLAAPVAGATVKNMENVNFIGLAGITVDTTAWGTTKLSITNSEAGNVAATVAAGTAVTASNAFATGTVAVTGGTTQTVSAVGGNVTLSGATGAVDAKVASMAASAVSVNGGTTVAVANTGVTTGTTTIGNTSAPTGAVTVSSTATGAVAAGAIAVTGGATVSVTQATSNAGATAGAVTVTGTANTTAVTTAHTGTGNKAAVTINDANKASTTAAGTIASVSVTNATAVTVDSGALSSLTLGGAITSVGVTAGTLSAPKVNTLGLNLAAATVTGTTTLDTDYTTLNVVTSAGASTLANLTASGSTAVNISGDSALTLTAHSFAAAAAITSTSTGNVTMAQTLEVAQKYAGGSGVDTITLGASTKANTTGAGNDQVTLTVDFGTGGSVDAGEGTDTLSMTAAVANTLSAVATFADKVAGFESIKLGASAANAVVNAARFDSVSTISSAGVTAGTFEISNLAATNAITFTGDLAGATTLGLATATGTADVVNVTFSATNGTANAGGLTVANVETLNITTVDSDTTTAATSAFTLPLTAAAAKTIMVSGGIGVNFSNATGTALTKFDASGLTATGDVGAHGAILTTGALVDAATITGGAGYDTLNAADATKAVTMAGNAGNDTLTGGAGADSIDGGAGEDTLTGGAGADTMTGGDGNDTLNGGTGADTLTGGAGVDTFVVSSATDSNGTNQDTITDFTAGTDKLGLTGETIKYIGEANGYGAVLTALTGAGAGAGISRDAVLDTSTNTLYIDVNGDKALTNADVTIKLTGISKLAQADFASFAAVAGSTFTGVAGAQNTFVGAAGPDTMTGAELGDTLLGNGGNDTLSGLAGADVIRGGTGVDTVSGGDGNDLLVVVGSIDAKQQTAYAGVTQASVDTLLGAANVLNVVTDLQTIHTTTDVAVGDVYSGGAGSDTLHIWGIADFTGSTINNDIETTSVHSAVKFTKAQLDSLLVLELAADSKIIVTDAANATEALAALAKVSLIKGSSGLQITFGNVEFADAPAANVTTVDFSTLTNDSISGTAVIEISPAQQSNAQAITDLKAAGVTTVTVATTDASYTGATGAVVIGG
jgi:S-layer protein